jgi:hypothetical protein
LETDLSMPPPDHLFQHRLAPLHIDDEGGHQPAQIEAPVEPVGEGSQVRLAVLSVLQGVERARQRGLQVAQHGVDPLERGQVLRFEGTYHAGDVDAAGVGDGGEASQAVAEDDAAGLQTGLRPLADGLEAKPLTTSSFRCVGPQFSSSDSAATNGTLFSEPRPALPPERSPPR